MILYQYNILIGILQAPALGKPIKKSDILFSVSRYHTRVYGGGGSPTSPKYSQGNNLWVINKKTPPTQRHEKIRIRFTG